MKTQFMKTTFTSVLTFLLILTNIHAQFVKNKGQVLDFNENFHPEVMYYYSDQSASVYFQSDRLVYNFKETEKTDLERFENDRAGYEEALRNQKATYHRMDMVFQNASLNPAVTVGKQNQGVTHFYLNKRNGIRDVASFETIKYENIYPHIDAVFYQTPKGLKYDLVLKEGANISDIKLKFEGASLKTDPKKIIISTGFKDITEEIPLSFIDGNTSSTVNVEYVQYEDGCIGFELKDKINYSSLTIDPVLEWGSYFNMSSGTDNVYNIANHLDNDGNFYSYGMAQSAANNYPVVNPGGSYTTAANGSADAYFVKFDANRQLVWSTYLGGSGYEEIYDGEIITTSGNTLHLVGERITTGAPFTNGGGFYQANASRNFWARFNKNTGVLEHLTSLSSGYKPSISVSSSGLVAIANDVYDFNNLPLLSRAGAYNQSVNGGTKDMGLLLFNSSYTQIWGTYVGGTGSQENFMCAFDNSNNIYFVGETSNNAGLVNLSGAYNQTTAGGGTDVMLGKFTSTGSLVWSTLYGGNGSDARRGQQGHGARILVHPSTGELILAFNTTSTNLPLTSLAGAYNKGVPTHIDFGGASGSFWNYAAYLCKFSTAGALNYSTYYYSGTGGGDIIENIAFGGCNKLYIGGAGDALKSLTGAGAGYNLITGTGSGRSGYITMLNSSTFAFEWDSYMNPNISSEANVAANVNQAKFYSMTTLYYNNLPVVDPGGGAYYNATSSNSTGAGVGISQFHPALPPSITGASTAICSGSSATLTASGGMGSPYNWYSSPSSPTILQTGASYTVNPANTTTYYVSSGSGICASPRVPVTVTVNTVAAGTAGISTTAVCSGSNANLTLTGHSGTIQWQVSTDGGNSWNNISGATTTPYTLTNITTNSSYRAVVTNSGCTGNSNAVAITITPTVIPAVSISGAPVSAICSGSSVTFTANPTNGGTPTYQWQVNGGNVSGATNSTFTTNTLNNGDVVTVIMGSTATCASPASVSANTAAITVNSTVTPSVSISGAPVSAICSGSSVTFTANPTNGGTPTYQWQVNGGNISGATNSTFTSTTLNNGDVVTVIMGSTATCASPASVSANTAAITVNSTVTPSVSISGAPVSAICSGSSVTFTANPTNGGTPTYQWQVNGGNVSGATNSTFTTNTLNNGDVVTVIMGSTATCASPASVSANTAAITVNSTVTPSVSISGAPVSAICSGSSVTFTANPTNGGTPTYQWQVNGVDVSGATNSTFTTTSLNNTDVVTVVMTSSLSCVSTSTTSGSTSAIAVNSNVTPSVTISGAPVTSICSGSSVTFTANPTNGGTPTYQWQVNGSDVAGETNVTFTTTTLNNGDVVTVIMNSNAACASPASASANTSSITVTNNVIPGATINRFPDAVLCTGTLAIFTANPTNGGNNPTYQWQVNGSDVPGATGSSFSTSTLNNGDVVTVVITSNAPCASPATISVSTVPNVVNAVPAVSWTAPGTQCVNYAPFTLSGGTPSGGAYTGPGVSAGQFNPSSAGTGTHTVTYTYTDVNGCSNTATGTITVSGCLGIEEESSTTLSIYPNPSNGLVTFEFNNNNQEVFLQLVTTTGQVVYTSTFNTGKVVADLSNLAPAVYYVHVLAGGKNITSKLVIH